MDQTRNLPPLVGKDDRYVSRNGFVRTTSLFVLLVTAWTLLTGIVLDRVILHPLVGILLILFSLCFLGMTYLRRST